MTQNPAPPSPPTSADPAAAAVSLLADNLLGVVRIARALAKSNREVELLGFDRSAGLLCAKTLDLPIEQGRPLRAKLVLLRSELDSLSATLRSRTTA